MILHNLKSKRNTTRIMKDLEEYVIMKRHYERNGEAVYYLNQKGKDYVGCDKEFKWTEHIEHHLMRNDIYLYFGCPKDWIVEQKITFKVGTGLQYKEYIITPDATFTKDKQYHFIEVDRKQTMRENKKKIELYGMLKEVIHKNYGHMPKIIFYTSTHTRKHQLEKWCKEYSLNYTIYTKEDLK